MDESFKIICRLIEKQSITYSEAYELLKEYFSSKKTETDTIFFDHKNLYHDNGWYRWPNEIYCNDDSSSIKPNKPWYTTTFGGNNIVHNDGEYNPYEG